MARTRGGRITTKRSVFGMLGHGMLEMIFARVEPDSMLMESLTCTQFSTLRRSGGFQTDVLAMNQTPAMFAWATSLGCPLLQ